MSAKGTVPITVIGIGEDGLDGLPPSVRARIEGADVLAGGARHLDMVPGFAGERVDWSSGIDAGLDAIAAHAEAGRAVVVLASGDPLYFGVGKNVVERFGADATEVIAQPGAIDLACARMGWSQPDVQVVTLHGRPLDSLNLHLTPGRCLVALTQDGATPAQVAERLTAQGFGPSRLVVLERLGGAIEKRIAGRADAWGVARCDDLNTLAIELVADAQAKPLSRVAGLPDDAYDHDGQLTKRHMRAVTLSSLAPLPGEVLWDLGAGAGSISIEWMRAHESCRAVAVERDPERAERIRHNAAQLGVPKLRVEGIEAQAALDTLDGAPDAIFIGGSVAHTGMLARAWDRLKPGGRLVANAVTKLGAAALLNFQDAHGGDVSRIGVEHRVPGTVAFEPKAPITHYVGQKPRTTS